MRKYLLADRIPPDQIMFASAKNGQEKQAYAALKKSMEQYPQYQVRDQSDYKQELKDQIGQLLNMVYGLLALAIVVAVLGVINTLALSVVERTREIGLMRAIGMSRCQLRRMIRLESVVIALFGALLGLGLGMGWAPRPEAPRPGRPEGPGHPGRPSSGSSSARRSWACSPP